MAKRRRKKRSFVRRVFRGLLYLLMLLIIIIGILVVVFYFKYGKQLSIYGEEARTLVENSNKDTFKKELNGKILYDDGRVLSYLQAGKNLHYIHFEDLPSNVTDAFVAVEDRRFYKHNGIDKKGIVRVLWNFVRSKGRRLSGASTITQQLARNIFLTHEVSFERKVKEAFIALDLEKKYSKNQILEYYINNIYFGNGYYGIGSASRGYFNKPVKKLSLSQVAFLAAIPNNPGHYNPLEHKDKTILRRDKILKDMNEQGYITKKELSKALKEKISLKESKSSINDYETTYAIECAARYLMKHQGFKTRHYFNSSKDYKEYQEDYQEIYEQCRQRIYTEGFEIKTSINRQKQNTLQKNINEVLKFSKDKKSNKVYSFQGAAVCIDNATGKVVAIVGGRKQSNIGGFTLNRAFQSYRQPGSTIKPLVVYTPSIENGYTADTVVEDTKIDDGPANSGNSYLGNISLATAVQKSKNVVAWKLMDELTPVTGLSYIQEMMFRKIVPSDYVNVAALGGLTYGATCEEMAGAYATLANSGLFREPTCIVSIIKDHEEIYKEATQRRIYSKAAAQEMTDILRGVLTKGTAAKLGWRSNVQAAAKTGTTNDSKDGWFCGYTPYYSIAVWVGYDEPKSMPGLWGSSYPASIWKLTMLDFISDKVAASFDTSSIGGEKNPTKISEYALEHTVNSTINKSDTDTINKVNDLLNQLENLDASDTDTAKNIYGSAKSLITGIQDRQLRKDYMSELENLYSGFKTEADMYEDMDKPPDNNADGTDNTSGNTDKTNTGNADSKDKNVDSNQNSVNDNSSDNDANDNKTQPDNDNNSDNADNSENIVDGEPIIIDDETEQLLEPIN